MQSTINGTTTAFVGNYYEVSGATATKYYYAGGQRVAMRVGTTAYYLLSEHLGSTSITADGAGNKVAELRYKAFGEVRYSSGTTPSGYTYTGQYSNVSDFGLMYYGARWYDPGLGRFASADSIVPGGVQGLDRYAYALGNPLRYIDPTGHTPAGPRPPCEDSMEGCGYANIGLGSEPSASGGDGGGGGGDGGLEGRIVTAPTLGADSNPNGCNFESSNYLLTCNFDTTALANSIPGTSQQWASGATFVDEAALVYDALLGVYVVTWSAVGLAGGLSFEGNPVTGIAGAGAGYIIGEGSIAASGMLLPSNAASLLATAGTAVADAKSGNTSIVGQLSMSSSGISFTAAGQVSSNTLLSGSLTSIGIAARIVTINLPVQVAAVANDRGVFGTSSIPISTNVYISIP